MLGDGWAQLWDVLEPVLEKVEWALPRRRCVCCRKVTAAVVPHARAGCVSYGPRLNAAAVLLATEGNVPVERAAMLIAALLGVPVSSGFVARAVERLAATRDAAGFDAAMRTALGAEDVLCGDERAVNVLGRDVDDAGRALAGTPHIVTVRTPAPGLVWYAPTHSRSSEAIEGLQILSGFRGYLVRDGYAGWYQCDAQLAGVQECCAHLIRHLRGVVNLDPKVQAWAGRLIDLLREAYREVAAARAAGHDRLDADLLAALRARYDKDVEWGRLTNRCRDWTDGAHHPGHVLATRFATIADRVWLFATNVRIPWTNNACEQALRLPKRHQAVSGYWHTPATLAAYCRVRSYLVSASDHGLRAIEAITTALAGKPWLPVPRTNIPAPALATTA